MGEDPENECTPPEMCQGDGTCGTCGVAAPPVGGACPGVCNGGCPNDVCIIDCSLAACDGVTVTCPAGFACEVQCSASQSCRQSTINCPDDHACDIDCSGAQGCRQAAINCSADGPCAIACGAANQACLSADVTCGNNACTATCADPNDPPTLTCGSACLCTSC
jgi:hypothetical protein